MISIKRFKFNFINVPKNASTSVRKFFVWNVVQSEDSYSYYFDDILPESQNVPLPHANHSHMDVTYAIRNGLLDPTETVVGVIRHPVERVISLFLYREKQKFSNEPKLTVYDFRKLVTEHGYLPDRPWHNQLQTSFLEYEGKQIGKWWLFDNIQKHIDEFVEENNINVKYPLEWKNKSIRGHLTKDYIHTFYDAASLSAVNKYYEKDIELYERLKCSL